MSHSSKKIDEKLPSSSSPNMILFSEDDGLFRYGIDEFFLNYVLYEHITTTNNVAMIFDNNYIFYEFQNYSEIIRTTNRFIIWKFLKDCLGSRYCSNNITSDANNYDVGELESNFKTLDHVLYNRESPELFQSIFPSFQKAISDPEYISVFNLNPQYVELIKNVDMAIYKHVLIFRHNIGTPSTSTQTLIPLTI